MTAPTGYNEAMTTAAFFDVSDRTRLEMNGSDRRNFLHNFCTNDILKLSDGACCEAFLLNAKGRMLGHIFVAAESDRLLISSVPKQAQTLVEHLEKYHLLEDFQLVDRSGETNELLITGPNATNILRDCGVPDLDLFQNWRGAVASECEAVVQRLNILKQPGFLVTANDLSGIRNVLRYGEAAEGSAEALEALRIEAGFPVYGLDLSVENLAQEACRTDTTISFTKGCYLGQEPVARLHALGHVNRELRVVKVTGTRPPVIGTTLQNPNKADKEIGVLTSVAWSWAQDSAVAIATIRSQFASPGTELPLSGDEGSHAIVLDT